MTSMRDSCAPALRWGAAVMIGGLTLTVAIAAQDVKSAAPVDALAEAQTPRAVATERPEQKQTGRDRSDLFDATKAEPAAPAFNDHPEQGKTLGFDFYRDP